MATRNLFTVSPVNTALHNRMQSALYCVYISINRNKNLICIQSPSCQRRWQTRNWYLSRYTYTSIYIVNILKVTAFLRFSFHITTHRCTSICAGKLICDKISLIPFTHTRTRARTYSCMQCVCLWNIDEFLLRLKYTRNINTVQRHALFHKF